MVRYLPEFEVCKGSNAVAAVIAVVAPVPPFAIGNCPETSLPKRTVSVLFAPFIVLLVKVSVVSLPTKVSVEVGKVNVPVLLILDIIGKVSVLLVKVSVVSLRTTVPVAFGRVIVLAAVGSTTVSVVLFASTVDPSNSI